MVDSAERLIRMLFNPMTPPADIHKAKLELGVLIAEGGGGNNNCILGVGGILLHETPLAALYGGQVPGCGTFLRKRDGPVVRTDLRAGINIDTDSVLSMLLRTQSDGDGAGAEEPQQRDMLRDKFKFFDFPLTKEEADETISSCLQQLRDGEFGGENELLPDGNIRRVFHVPSAVVAYWQRYQQGSERGLQVFKEALVRIRASGSIPSLEARTLIEECISDIEQHELGINLLGLPLTTQFTPEIVVLMMALPTAWGAVGLCEKLTVAHNHSKLNSIPT